MFTRYALYHLPDDEMLARWGARWLGWDAVRGAARDAPLPHLTEDPRRYGFHATIKAPFALAPGTDEAGLLAAAKTLCTTLTPLRIGMGIATMGRFLALRPGGDTTALDAMAFEVVKALDGFRAQPRPEDLARRRVKGLRPVQDAMLVRWGYPHVGAAFRFHITLTGPLDEGLRAEANRALRADPPPIPTPFALRSLSLMGEDAEGRFHQIARLPLGSQPI